jgi:hypothetical protein
MVLLTVLTDLLCIGCLLLWGALLCLALRIPAGFGPILGVGFCMVVLQAFGAIGLLWPGSILFFAGAPLSAFLCCRSAEGRGHLRSAFCCTGVLAFTAACLLLEVIYLVQTPRFQTWDEFSHWGVFFKNVFYLHEFDIHTAGVSFGHQSYPQGGMALYALFALFKRVYTERDVFFCTTLPLLACAAALFALPRAESHYRPGRIFTVLCAVLAVPLLFSCFVPDTPYTTAYMDAPVGALFAAALLLCFLPQRVDWHSSLAVGILCAATASCKEIGTVFALCVLGIWFVLCLHCTLAEKRIRPLTQSFLPCCAVFGASWGLWKAALAVLNRSTDQFSSMGLSHFLQCRAEAVSGQDPYFYTVWDAFYAKIRTAPLLFGWSTFKLGVICAVLSVAAAVLLVCFGGRNLLGQAAAPLLMTAFFPCYFFVLFYVYIGGMSAYEALRMASYERYACCFFIGWFAVLFAALFSLSRSLPHRAGVLLSTVLCTAFAAVSLLSAASQGLSSFVLPKEDWRDTQIQQAAALHSIIDDPSAAVWLLSADADTAYQNLWYYHYELYPDNICIEIPSSEEDVDLDYNIGGHSIRYLVLFGATDAFRTQYAARFSDALASVGKKGSVPVVYRVMDSGVFALMPGSGSLS